MPEEKEPEVEIVDGPIETTEVETKKEGGDDATKIVTADEGAAELKRKLAEEQSRREAAEAAARTATEVARTATAAVEDGEMREINAAIATSKSNLDIAKNQYRQARANGDIDAEVEATEAIAQAKADLNALEAGRLAREQAKKNPQPVIRQAADPVDMLAQDIGQNWPKSADWIRANRDIVRKDWGAVQSASNMAIRAGKAADTPEYFAHVERLLRDSGVMAAASTNGTGNGHAEEVQRTEENAMSQASRPVAPAAAPVSRNGGGPGQPRPGVIRLTRGEAEMAELSYPHLVQKEGKAAAHRAYAQAKQDARANGKMN